MKFKIKILEDRLKSALSDIRMKSQMYLSLYRKYCRLIEILRLIEKAEYSGGEKMDHMGARSMACNVVAEVGEGEYL